MNIFDTKVNKQILQLRKGDYQQIESEIIRKRISWINENLSSIKSRSPFTPRDVFELLFFKQMELKKDELPIVKESNDEIMWLSYNRCPTLEACNALNLDTREVCRFINEKATQAFISKIDPQFRFHRSYKMIRPYTPYCEEKIIRIDFEYFMNLAIKEASLSKTEGNAAYGAVVVFEGQVIGKAHDIKNTEPTSGSHAVTNAIHQAIRRMNDTNLCGAILFTTCEPCSECKALAIRSNLTSIVYGLSVEESVPFDNFRFQENAAPVDNECIYFMEIIGDVLRDHCKKLCC